MNIVTAFFMTLAVVCAVVAAAFVYHVVNSSLVQLTTAF